MRSGPIPQGKTTKPQNFHQPLLGQEIQRADAGPVLPLAALLLVRKRGIFIRDQEAATERFFNPVEIHMKTLPPLKRGDTFQFGGQLKDDNGQPKDLTLIDMRAQARVESSGMLLADLIVGKADQVANPGQFVVSAINTDHWPITTLLIDIEMQDGQIRTSSETMQLPIIADVTHD